MTKSLTLAFATLAFSLLGLSFAHALLAYKPAQPTPAAEEFGDFYK